jgi:hypothetical protein
VRWNRAEPRYWPLTYTGTVEEARAAGHDCDHTDDDGSCWSYADGPAVLAETSPVFCDNAAGLYGN